MTTNVFRNKLVKKPAQLSLCRREKRTHTAPNSQCFHSRNVSEADQQVCGNLPFFTEYLYIQIFDWQEASVFNVLILVLLTLRIRESQHSTAVDSRRRKSDYFI